MPVIVDNRKGTRDGIKAQFSQPTGICFDDDTRMTSSVTSLIDYLKQLHLFGETFDHFWTSQKKSTSVTVEIP